MTIPLIATLQQQIQALEAQGLLRRRRTTASACDVHVDVDGRPLLSFNSNDYLGLAADARVVEALREGASLYGAGSGASHLISGHSKVHAQLEDRLAGLLSPHLEQARALTFSTGYMANLSLLSALASPSPREAEIFSDALNHASLIDGTRLSRAQITVYPHVDVAALAQALARSSARTKLVVTDSVFSMDGDIAPLPALLALCEQHGAWLVVDDAHGFGVLGEQGRGVLEHFALRSPYLIYMGTLGKAAGVAGAFVAAHATVIDWLVQRARPYIYTTASAPALAHALLTSIDLLAGDEGKKRRAHLTGLRLQLADLSVKPGWQRLDSVTPIQPLVIGSNEDALAAADALETQGLWVSAIRAPTVPAGTARLRITLSASHSHADVDRLKSALAQVRR
jgi:8-amino-7-oxononanoate synthase